MQTYTYTVHIEAAEEGGYVAHVPTLNDIATQGETYQETIARAQELIVGYLEVLAKRGKAIPTEPTPPSMPVALSMQVSAPAFP